MTAATFVASSSASAAATSVVVPAPSGLASGDHQIVVLGIAAGAETLSAAPSGWTLRANLNNGSDPGPYRTAVYTSSTATGSTTFSKSGTSIMFAVRLAWRNGPGFDAASVATGTTTTSTTSATLPACTTSSADSLVIGVVHCDTSSGSVTTHTPPGGWTERFDSTAASGSQVEAIGVFEILKTTAGTQAAGTVTLSRSDYTSTVTISLNGYVATETVTAADTATGTDAVTAVSGAATADDTATGVDTASVVDETAENVTAADTATGVDTAASADAVADTADGVDTADLVETGSAADTASGVDAASFADGQLFVSAETGAGFDQIAWLDVPFTQVLEFRQGPTYEVVIVSTVFQTSGPPTLIEVDPIEWSSIKYSNELSRPQTLDVTCLVDTVPETILQRLRKPADLPTELHLLRDGRRVFAGPLRGGRPGAKTLTLVAHGLLSYLQEMVVTADLVFAQVDQHQIVKGLVDHWQNLEYGNLGIDTSSIGASGQLRDATYLRNELHEIGQRVAELGGRRNGFDVEVDPLTRKLQLWSPTKGVDRSSGEDAVVFDARNITTSGVMFSVAAGDVASDAFGTGTGLYSAQANLELRARYGRRAVTGTWDSVSEQPTLDAHVQGLLDARGEALWVPSPDLRVTPDADLGAYGVGDTVAFEVHERIGISGSFRIRKQDISVTSTGVESVSLGFV